MGDVPVSLPGQVDWIVLSPEPLAGAGRPFPQAEIAWIRKHSWVDDVKTKVVFQSPILQNLFHPFQTQDDFLVQLRILEILNVLRVVATLAKNVARDRRDEDRPSFFQSLSNFCAASQNLFYE
jgi:hypothetical protein